MLSRSVTQQYPEVQPELPPRSRGVIGLVEENCTVCMLCARECPDWCIYIDSHKETLPAPEGGRPRARNVLDRFAIDFSLCMYCGICIEACPFDALFWSPEFEYAEGDIRNLLHEKDKLAAWAATVPPPPAHEPNADPPKELAATSRPVPSRAGPGVVRPGGEGAGAPPGTTVTPSPVASGPPGSGAGGRAAAGRASGGPGAGGRTAGRGDAADRAAAGADTAGTVEPGRPAGPVEAVAPAGTVEPAEPVEAVAPVEPVGPVGPVEPVSGAAPGPSGQETRPTGPVPGAPDEGESAATAGSGTAAPSSTEPPSPSSPAPAPTGRGPERPARRASAGHASVRAIRPPGALPKKDAPSTGESSTGGPSAEKLSTGEGGVPPATGTPEQTSATDPSGEPEEET
ncbi:4Fe-4S binding protein [Streptosporangium sp. NPDC051023]|uniref:4Fe-4S binding protein n=1 Tax=Streptosporangium sp. NPDC051023 TaxID=3155410 RepID=UPI00344B2305